MIALRILAGHLDDVSAFQIAPIVSPSRELSVLLISTDQKTVVQAISLARERSEFSYRKRLFFKLSDGPSFLVVVPLPSGRSPEVTHLRSRRKAELP
jgi:hypothetical protein